VNTVDVLALQLPVTIKDIAAATKSDDLLQEVIALMRNGWPNKSPKPELDAYFTKRTSLSIVQGCLITGNRTVVPKGKLRKNILQALHLGHPGIQRMKSLARLHVFTSIGLALMLK
jgi:hypothetical protein